jgi:predicted ATP-grasp superfamily ATP-dependent carboligase
MNNASVMIIDGDARAALSVVRSMGRLGVHTMVGSGVSFARAAYSRYTSRRFRYPAPEDDPQAAHEVILRHIRDWKPDILFPVYDGGWGVVYEHLEEYRRHTTVVPCPPSELRARVTDKAELTLLAQKHGIDTPQTYPFANADEALSTAADLPYPLLLKPRRGVSGRGIQRVDSRAALVQALSCTRGPMPLIQEFIDGYDCDLSILCNQGETIAVSTYRTLRNAPLPYGPPVASRTFRDEGFVRAGMRFMEAIGYHGMANLDFRRDRRDGKFKLLDFNGRLAGTTEISICSGVDFPRLLYQIAANEPLAPGPAKPFDIEFRWLGEIHHLLQTQHKLRTVRELLHFRNVYTEVSLKDPAPYFVIFWDACRRLLKGRA